MKILITGGAGFIASHLVDSLIKQGHKVVVVDNLSTGSRKNLNPKARFYRLDIISPKLREIFKKEKPLAVFHFAAQIDVRRSVSDPLYDAEVNIKGSLNVLENCKNYKAKKVIFASSGGAIYGDAGRKFIPTKENYPPQPMSPYGITKLTVENYLEYYYAVFGLRYVALRFGNVYGPRQNSKGEAGVVAIFADRLLKNQGVVINGNGHQTRDYVYVKDVVEAALLGMRKSVVGSFNIGTGRETDVNQLFNKLIKHIPLKNKMKHGPAKRGEQLRSCLDNGLAKKDLGWKPKTTLDEGIKKTVEWFKKRK